MRIYGEQGEGKDDNTSFASHPIWKRVLVILAGVLMNLVLAWFLFSLVHLIGIPSIAGEGVVIENPRVTILDVAPGSPAAGAKLAFGDVIESLHAEGDSISPKSTDEVTNFVQAHKGAVIEMNIQHNADTKSPIDIISVQSRANPPAGEGPLGVALQDIGITRSAWYLAPWRGLESVWYSITATLGAFVSVFKSAFTNHGIPAGVSGPLGLYVLTGQVQRLGLSYFLQFIALLSVNLAILNSVPFPALDGGRVLFLIIEKLRGKPVRVSYEQAAHAVGFVLLLLLILLISYSDINRFFL